MKITALSSLLFPILVFLGGCCFGPSGSVVKLAYDAGFSADAVLISQYLFGALSMLLISAGFFFVTCRKKRKQRVKYTAKDIIKLIFMGVVLGLSSLAYVLSLQTIPAHLAVILVFQYTWMGIIAESVIKRKLPTVPIVLSVVILIGATLLASGAGSISLDEINVTGVILALLSAAFYAAYIQLNAALHNGMNPIYRSFTIVTIALVVYLIVFTPGYFNPQYISEVVIGQGLWVYGVILGCLVCALPNFLFAVSMPHTPSGIATLLTTSELPASIICAVLILSESVTPLQWTGVALLFFGIALPYLAELRRKRMKSRRTPSPS